MTGAGVNCSDLCGHHSGLAQAGRPGVEASHSGHGGTGSRRWAAGGAGPDHSGRACQQHRGMWSPSAPCLSVGRSALQTQLAAAGKGGGRIADHRTEVDAGWNPVGSDAGDCNRHEWLNFPKSQLLLPGKELTTADGLMRDLG